MLGNHQQRVISGLQYLPDDLLVIARIGKAQGIKGWFRVHPETASKQQAFEYKPWHLYLDQDWQQKTLADWQVNGKHFIARFQNCDTRDQAEGFRNAWVAVPKSCLPEASEDELYYHQLEGLIVKTVQNDILGVVDYLFDTGANDVMVVKPTSASIDDRERLLPYLSPYVVKADIQTGVVEVDWDPNF